MSKLKKQNSGRESCFPCRRSWFIVALFCILCSSASCIRIRLLTAAAPACHAHCRTLLPIYIGAARRDVCTQLPIYQTHAQSASPPTSGSLLGRNTAPWWPPPATLVRPPGSINPNAYANLSSLRWLPSTMPFEFWTLCCCPSEHLHHFLSTVCRFAEASPYLHRRCCQPFLLCVRDCVYILLSDRTAAADLPPCKTWQRWRPKPCSVVWGSTHVNPEWKAMQGSMVKSGHSNGPPISHQNLHLSHNAALQDFLHQCNADPLWECKRTTREVLNFWS